MKEITIRTSDKGWVAKLASAYRNKEQALLIDDAQVGVDPKNDSLLMMGKKAGLTKNEWVAVGVAIGIGSAGIYLLIVAAADPEPFSKMGLTIAAGGLLTFGGGFSAIRILTGHKPPSLHVDKNGIHISWD